MFGGNYSSLLSICGGKWVFVSQTSKVIFHKVHKSKSLETPRGYIYKRVKALDLWRLIKVCEVSPGPLPGREVLVGVREGTADKWVTINQ